MLIIQNLLKKAYFGIRSMAKKLYKSCAVCASGFTVFALVLFNGQNFYGGEKVGMTVEHIALSDIEEKLKKEGSEAALVLEGNLGLACRDFLVESPEHVREDVQVEISKHEVEAVCAQIAPEVHSEMRIQPINPYGEIAVAQEDYDALCRIVQAEAGGEDTQGKVLVAEVVLNRVLSESFASTVYDVIFERSGGSAQFSPTVDGRYYSVTVTTDTINAVEEALYGEDVSQGALFFSARSKANPNDMGWFDRNLKWLFAHGGHEFYTLP